MERSPKGKDFFIAAKVCQLKFEHAAETLTAFRTNATTATQNWQIINCAGISTRFLDWPTSLSPQKIPLISIAFENRKPGRPVNYNADL